MFFHPGYKKKSISDQSGTKLALFDDTDTYIVYI